MKRTATIFLLLVIATFLQAQVIFKTVVPQQPLVEGEAFQVQYIAERGVTITNFKTPSFKGFRLVNGPAVYMIRDGYDNSLAGINNLFTLRPLRSGSLLIPGTTAVINGKNYRSNDVWVRVVSREEADKQKKQEESSVYNTMSFLRPGEDPYEKIKKNLFVKVMVNRKSCFAGEPIVATFKLYSRLQSRSEIVKNPGFYGFSVQDMINLDDKMITDETVNGERFDVHTIRKVQLYPLQAGVFTIDAMEIKNKVEFSRSAINKKTEQEIVEGVVEEKETTHPGTEVFESHISTGPVTITVKPVPLSNKPNDFNGATGYFSIIASLEKKEIAKNEEGYLVISIKGKGNFSQLSAPSIQWPEGIEGFSPTVADTLDKAKSPLEGNRTFRYAFVTANPGIYHLPPVSFSFFDPAGNRYTTLTTDSLEVAISHREKAKETVAAPKASLSDVNRRASYVAAGIVVSLLLIVLVYWLTKKSKTSAIVTSKEDKPATPAVSPHEILKPAYLLIPAADKDFYSILHQSVWKYLAQQFNLSGSEMNKQVLHTKMKQAGKPPVAAELIQILEHCEAGIFTNANMGEDKEALLGKVKGLLEDIGNPHKNAQ